MKIRDYKEYLNNFDDEEELGIIIVNPKERKHYPIQSDFAISDMACLCIEIGDPENMDEENLIHTKLDDQMTIDESLGA